MLAGVNDGPEQAHELGRLLGQRSQQYMVNLIPWNPVFSPGIDFEAPSLDRLSAFHDIVRSHGLQCTVRREMGQEIAGRLLASHSCRSCKKAFSGDRQHVLGFCWDIEACLCS